MKNTDCDLPDAPRDAREASGTLEATKIAELPGIEEGLIRIEGRSNVRIAVAPRLETVIRCERVSFTVDGREVEIRGAVIRIEGETP